MHNEETAKMKIINILFQQIFDGEVYNNFQNSRSETSRNRGTQTSLTNIIVDVPKEGSKSKDATEKEVNKKGCCEQFFRGCSCKIEDDCIYLNGFDAERSDFLLQISPFKQEPQENANIEKENVPTGSEENIATTNKDSITDSEGVSAGNGKSDVDDGNGHDSIKDVKNEVRGILNSIGDVKIKEELREILNAIIDESIHEEHEPETIDRQIEDDPKKENITVQNAENEESTGQIEANTKEITNSIVEESIQQATRISEEQSKQILDSIVDYINEKETAEKTQNETTGKMTETQPNLKKACLEEYCNARLVLNSIIDQITLPSPQPKSNHCDCFTAILNATQNAQQQNSVSLNAIANELFQRGDGKKNHEVYSNVDWILSTLLKRAVSNAEKLNGTKSEDFDGEFNRDSGDGRFPTQRNQTGNKRKDPSSYGNRRGNKKTIKKSITESVTSVEIRQIYDEKNVLNGGDVKERRTSAVKRTVSSENDTDSKTVSTFEERQCLRLKIVHPVLSKKACVVEREEDDPVYFLMRKCNGKSRCRNIIKTIDGHVTESDMHLSSSSCSTLCTKTKYLSQIKSLDWKAALKGLREVVELCKIDSKRLHNHMPIVNQKIIELLRCPRVNVCRVTCQLVGDLFQYNKTPQCPEFDEIVDILLSRTVDANSFVRDEANFALNRMVECVRFSQVLRALSSKAYGEKNPHIRLVIARLLVCALVIEGPDYLFNPQSNQLTRQIVLEHMMKFLLDENVQVRSYAKKLYKVLSRNPNFFMFLKHSFNSSQIKEMKKSLKALH